MDRGEVGLTHERESTQPDDIERVELKKNWAVLVLDSKKVHEE